jgi:hypothetical protein
VPSMIRWLLIALPFPRAPLLPCVKRVAEALSLHFSPAFATRVTRRRGQAGFLALGRGGVLCSTLSTPRRESTSG